MSSPAQNSAGEHPHKVGAALVTVDAAHAVLIERVDELARRHGTRAAARLLGVSAQTVSRWRRGDTPGRAALRAALNALNGRTS